MNRKGGKPRVPPVDHAAAPAAIRSLKAELRKQVIARRDALSAAERKSSSHRITRRLLALEVYRRARCVMVYVTLGSEFETGDFIADLLAQGKKLVLPRVERGGQSLALHEVRDRERQLEAGVWGILQPRPDSCPVVPAAQVDFVLVPGVAFTRQGDRMGYGAGYYDRLIAGFGRRPALVAAAFGIQLVDALPMSETDQRVDRVVTENAEYERREA